jgi:hypothetical protein
MAAALCRNCRRHLFVNFADQNLYRTSTDGTAPTQITAGSADTRYADFVYDELRARLIAVTERPAPTARKLSRGRRYQNGRRHRSRSWSRLFTLRREFRPAANNSASQLGSSEHAVDGTIASSVNCCRGTLENDTIIAGGAAEQSYSPNGLPPSAWSLPRINPASGISIATTTSGIYCIYADAAEYAGPAWTFGARHFVVLGPRHVSPNESTTAQGRCRSSM